jgi:hypothetical protein
LRVRQYGQPAFWMGGKKAPASSRALICSAAAQ